MIGPWEKMTHIIDVQVSPLTQDLHIKSREAMDQDRPLMENPDSYVGESLLS